MLNIARASIEKPLYTWLIILTMLLGGIWGFFNLGRLEDPAFTIKQAVVVTQYPGASAAQVATEVSEPLESALQKMEEVERITSTNRPGESRIDVEIKSTYPADALPAIWTRLRARVRDTARLLPDNARPPFVNDSFGDVFGLYYAVTAPGFSDAEKYELGTFLRRELLAVDGVAGVDLSGIPEEAIYIEPDMTLSFNQGIPPNAIIGAVSAANSVSSAGSLDKDGTRIMFHGAEGSETVSDIASLSIGVNGLLFNVADVARVSRGRSATPDQIIRFNGEEAFTIGIAGLDTEDIVKVGHRVDARLAHLSSDIPHGIELHPIYQQHVVVEQSSNDFLKNLAMSVGIVIVVLGAFMGWRAAVVIGSTLLLTVVGTLLFMSIFSIEMERISLGALIIAMGMLVDNAIVVAEGMQISMLRGRRSIDAADDAAKKTQIPLLGATVIGIMAFAGIGLSPDSTGEFLFSLFAVIGISLLLSWVLALTVTPLLGHYLFKLGNQDADDAYSGRFFVIYKKILDKSLTFRWPVIAGLVAITMACFAGFGSVKQQFFPNSNTPLFFVYYKLPQGTAIQQVSDDLKVMEDWLLKEENVTSVASYAGRGAVRFMLTYDGGKDNQSYGHLIIRTSELDAIPDIHARLEAFGKANFPAAEFRVQRLVFGPGGGDPIQARFSGSDPAVLRALANQAMQVMADSTDHLLNLRTDWREQELVIEPVYATQRAQTAGVNRDDIASSLLFATDGLRAGVYRERERQIPIIMRRPKPEEFSLTDQLVFSPVSGTYLPIEQLTDGFKYRVENTLVQRRNRVPTISVGADVATGVTPAQAHDEIRAAVEAIPLPAGYAMEWGGEFENSSKAQASLGAQLPLSVLIMVMISILLFNAIRQPIIIWLLVPMSVNGVVVGLLGTGLPFSFTALLGLLSLSGMLIKNGIVLVEEIDLVRAEGVPLRKAVIEASASRVRPVILAAVTTILGMAPLLSDAFFVSMSVTIMGGLAFASVLTLVAAPVFYYVFFKGDEKRELAASLA